MRWNLTTIEREGVPCAAVVVDSNAYPLPCDMATLLADWPAAAQRIEAAATRNKPVALDDITLCAPLMPPAIYCAGANYVDHVIEMLGRPPAPKEKSEPFFFMKPSRPSIVGPGATVALPHAGVRLDWEAEIAVVIGRPARHVREADAMDHVAGYAIVNDLSARDLMKRSDVSFTYDWIGQKCFPGALPLGPWITPTGAVPDPHDLGIRLWVNDRLMQDSSSRQMHWSIPEQIAYLSRRVGLEPGDLIATGTPAGCGVRMGPEGTFLRSGDVVRIEIDRLGALEHRIGPLETIE